ncbi:E3 ubiquitin-protein ligase MBR2 [Striga hermonthica]|uniref:RING-type E3 ubiquitin transferase n=1 Tax=Striga hermonthica TaxID=68872 RepID=A0A9N7RSL0_STRHE|nr:E3 ubiquitin-protein ligase MBR2 [Striga hermonthica]
MLNAPNILETDGGQEWNHSEQPYMPTTIVGASGSSPLIYPAVNIQGGPFALSTPTSNGHHWSILNVESTHTETEASDPPHDPFLHKPADTNSRLVPNNYLHGDFNNQTVGKVSQKRKNPYVPQISEMGSTSRYYDAGSSSNLHLPAIPYQENQNVDSYPTTWKYPPGHVLNSLSIGGESTPRNVRSRGNADVEPTPDRTRSSNFLNPFSSQSSDQTTLLGSSTLIPQAGHGVAMASGNSFAHDPNTLGSLNSHSNVSIESEGLSNNGGALNRNTIHQIANYNADQSFGKNISGYLQRTVPTLGASSSSFQAVQLTAPNDGPPITSESNFSRHRQVISAMRLLNRERNVRIGMPSDRKHAGNMYPYFSLANGTLFQRLLALGRSAVYGPNNPFDQHRDMRLDVDNMSYEELLVLGERIGSVCTGLSDDLISKCLTESILCSSDQSEDDGRCVICLEEYKDMDDLGSLKCGHDFHVGCIKKWLSMKNLCPICKTSAMDENKKDK